jgi:hypothetical protein
MEEEESEEIRAGNKCIVLTKTGKIYSLSTGGGEGPLGT